MSVSAPAIAERIARVDRSAVTTLAPLLTLAATEARKRAMATDLPMPSPSQERLISLEREAFDRGFEAGEAAGRDQARAASEATLALLQQTIETVSGLRTAMLARSEQDVVRLAVAIAELVLRREVRIDRAVLVHMAQQALQRIGVTAAATIAMNPDDLAVVTADRPDLLKPGAIHLEADPQLLPGACIVRGSFGTIDVTLDAQIRELMAALLDRNDD